MENAGGEEKNFFAKKFFLLPLHPLIIFKKLLYNAVFINILNNIYKKNTLFFFEKGEGLREREKSSFLSEKNLLSKKKVFPSS